MVVCCSNCNTQFRLDDHKVPPVGLRARCAKCGSVVSIAAVKPRSVESMARRAPTPIVHHPVYTHAALAPSGVPDELARFLMDSERERREMTWYMAREIVRVSDALERQSGLLTQIVEHVSTAQPREAGNGDAKLSSGDTAHELQAALAAEQEVVERLRRSGVEMERRAAEAEAKLDTRRRSIVSRIFGGDHD